MSNIIELNNISKTFDNKKKITVFKNLNFKFKKGKIYSLSGPSGSGKSTLLNLLSLIDRPSSGNIKIDNQNIDHNKSEVNDKIRSNNIGIPRIARLLAVSVSYLVAPVVARIRADPSVFRITRDNRDP